MNIERLKEIASNVKSGVKDNVRNNIVTYSICGLAAISGGSFMAIKDAPTQTFKGDDGHLGTRLVKPLDKALYATGVTSGTMASVAVFAAGFSVMMNNDKKKNQTAEIAKLKMMEKSHG